MLRQLSFQTSRVLLRSSIARRTFFSSALRLDAKIFEMPAMSPTMEEGGIVSWKVKEGDSFSAGDQLMDVETDKATIAVDAGDDGIMAKILVPEGTNGVKVGSPIAFLADPDDDIASLTYPDVSAGADAAAPAKEEAPAPAASEPAPAAAAAPAPPAGEAGKAVPANKDQTLFPSVEYLLEVEHIPRDKAIAEIPATGPNGRILRGDVLAYLGKIPQEDNTRIAAYIDSVSHLDLSHIQLAEPKPEGEAATASAPAEGDAPADAAAAAAAAAPPPPPKPTTVSYQYVLSSPVPENILSALVAKAASKAETAAYAAKDYAPSDLIDPLFEDLIAPPENAERFKVNYAISKAPKNGAEAIIDDPFDFEPYESTPATTAPSKLLTTVSVELTCNDKVFDSKDKAKVFVDKFGSYLSQIDSKYATA